MVEDDRFADWILKNPIRAVRLIGVIMMILGVLFLSPGGFAYPLSPEEQLLFQIPAIMWVVVWVLIIFVVTRLIRNRQSNRTLESEAQPEKRQETASFTPTPPVPDVHVPKENLGIPKEAPPSEQLPNFCALSAVLKEVKEVEDGA